MESEADRVVRLLAAQEQALALFDEIGARALIAPGRSERQVSDQIRDLAHEMFGVERHWHKRVVRAGPNTLHPYADNPPDRLIAEDDVVFIDLGPVFEGWEADFGRTFVLGDDPAKHRLLADLPRVFDAGRAYFEAHPDVTGAELFAEAGRLATAAGWTFGGPIAGHLVGEFPHARIPGNKIEYYVAPGSDRPMRRLDHDGRRCHWILEIHLVDEPHAFGGFFEQLLDLGPSADTTLLGAQESSRGRRSR
ncbi:aminopeptidase P family protein [Frankia sp. AgPm24]|uniref:M24 family metallopeptidase n=1 Tax=Frankia sp. AgPm24 TaxID=631128 RepID=UPI00200EFDB0|nr:M24 family metallopeptidase [Frankia sp. AgPm24]MCK9923066.1 aminopeptidase P family protein [Frankia sp. AgPm24]